jgi:hypothetical protein
MYVQAAHVLVLVLVVQRVTPVMTAMSVPMIHVMRVLMRAPMTVMPFPQLNPAVMMLHAMVQQSVQPVV